MDSRNRSIAMARYIPQHLFDGLVVYRLMADLAGSNELFDDLVRKYRDAYPDEDFALVIADVAVAAGEARPLVRVVADAPGAGGLEEMAVLRAFLDVFKADAARGKPLWRRMLANYFVGEQPTPIPDRVARARERFRAAQQALLARGVEPLAGSSQRR
jgi:hypothetical protein